MKALKADTSSAWLRTGGVDLNATHSEALLRAVNAQGHCSAVVKLSGDLNDLWLGHSTWCAPMPGRLLVPAAECDPE